MPYAGELMKKPRHRRTDPKRNAYGCDGAGNPITPKETNGAIGVYTDMNGAVYANIEPVDPSIQAEIDRILQKPKQP